MKARITNYTKGILVLEEGAPTDIREYFKEALTLLQDPKADQNEVVSFLEEKTKEVCKNAGIPIPIIEFPPEICEVNVIVLQACGRTIEILPGDTIKSLLKKWDKRA